MKLTKNGIFLVIGALLSLLMAFFTFFAWGWFSDRGFRFYFEIPIRTESGILSTLNDAACAVAPLFLILAFLLLFSGVSRSTTLLSRFLAVVPMIFSALLQIVSFLIQENVHFTLVITAFFLLLSGALTLASCFAPELGRFALQSALFHAGLETALVVISAVLQKKYSQFYFSQLLPMGHYSNFRYSFFVISFFLVYVFYSLSLAFLHASIKDEKPLFIKKAPTKKEPVKAASLSEEESAAEEEAFVPLSLEDFGIEK